MEAVAKKLGVSATTLRRLKGELFEPAPRNGKRRIRVFMPAPVNEIRIALGTSTLLGPAPKLLSLEEVARRAGYTPVRPIRSAVTAEANCT